MSFTQEEKVFMQLINSNIQNFNANKRKGILSVKYVVDGGNRAEVYKDETLLLNVTIEQAWSAIAGICRYVKEV